MNDHIKELWRAPVPDLVDGLGVRVREFMGLHLCQVPDLVEATFDPNYWVVALENSGETLVVLLCAEDKAIRIATEMAYMMDWTKVPDWDGIDLMPAQLEIISRYPGEAVPPLMSETDFPEDWDDAVPYGPPD